MKIKLLLAFVALSFICPTFGQSSSIKRVAILEIVDKDGTVPYGVKLMIRNKLGTAINNTAGYEAYDRVDIASIMNEQEFQRTGLVDNSQIRKLGDMTGASYVFVVEAANIDEKNVVIVAKILNVESAKIEQVANIHSSIEINKLEENCRTLAERLLKINLKTGASIGVLRIGDNIYKGEYKDDKPHGSGKMIFAKTDERESYNGQWVDGIIEGKGTMIYKNRSVYKGNFTAGQKNGEGVYHFSSRSYYRGSWKNGFMNGQGRIFGQDGKLKFSGKWKNGRKHGEGTVYYSNGDYEKVIYVEGEKNGPATYYYFQTGGFVKGEYIDNKKEGKWERYNSGHLLQTEIYKNGKLIKTKQYKIK